MEKTPEDLIKGYFELVKARPAYERAAAFYEGTVDEVYSSAKVTRLLNKFGLDAIDNFNFAHIPVDALANKLHINAITADDSETEEDESDEDKGSEKKSKINEVIEDLWEYNELGEEIPNLHRNIGKFGDYYGMVWPVVGDEASTKNKAFDSAKTAAVLGTEADAADPKADLGQTASSKSIVAVDILFHDPLTTRAFYDVENPRKMTYVIRSWEEGEGQNLVVRANLYYADRIERYFHKGKPSKRKNAQSKWEPFLEDGPAVLVNPFDQIPFFHYRTDRTYGKPDHINAYGPQLAINKLVTSHLATVDYQSFPQRFLLTDPTADASGIQGADSDPFAPDDDDDPEDDNHSQLEADPGAVWKLDGIKAAGQFEPANPDAYLKPFDRYVKAMSQVTGIPFHFFDRTGERPPSGENIRQVNESLNTKAETRQLGVGSVHRNLTEFALNLLGYEVERVVVTWRPLEVVTDLSGWQAINEKQLAGVPMATTLVEAGYLKSVVAKWEKKWEEEERKEIEAQQILNSTSNQNRYQGQRALAGKPQSPAGTPTPKAPSKANSQTLPKK